MPVTDLQARCANELIRIVFLLPDLSGGGAEKIVIEYLKNLDRNRYAAVLVLGKAHGPLLPMVPKWVEIHSLGKQSKLSFPLLVARFSRLMRAVKPDLVCSFLWYADAINILSAGRVPSWLTVCNIHCVPRTIQQEQLGGLKCRLMSYLYPKSAGVLTVSAAVKAEFSDIYLKDAAVPVEAIPNPLPISTILQKSKQRVVDWPVAECQRMVVVGRLERVKGIDILVDALSSIKSRWHLKILGTGSLHEELRLRVQRAGFSDRVEFVGYVGNPYPEISSADILILPSRFEAFPTVIFEALILHTAVIAADCPSGPAEMLRGGERGDLVSVENPLALAAAIDKYLMAIKNSTETRDYQLIKQEIEANHDSANATRHLESRLDEWLRVNGAES